MIVGINQPYLFPYIGYFQLINSVDVFVLYDDVSFIKRGWVNRNNLLVNGKPHLFTIPCKGASQNKKIVEVELFDESRKALNRLVTTIKHSYTKAPYYNDILPLIESVVSINSNSIIDLIEHSLDLILKHLNIHKTILRSSEQFAHTLQLNRSDRLIQICKELNADHYINTPGGQILYDKEYFDVNGVKLNFINSNEIKYSQFNAPFVPDLSIIDILMFNNKNSILRMLDDFTLS